jgi:hypothetical protein
MPQAINSGRCVTVHNDAQTWASTCCSMIATVSRTSSSPGRRHRADLENVVAQNSALCLTVSGGPQPIIQEPCASGTSAEEFILEQQ